MPGEPNVAPESGAGSGPHIGPAVIDASVGLKWLVPEAGTDAAVALRASLVEAGAPLYVPDLFWSETANGLWRLARGAEATLSRDEARELLAVLRLAPIRSEPVGPFSARALEVALATDLTTYDAAYVALAELVDARLWTADAALVRKLAGTEWEARVAGLVTGH